MELFPEITQKLTPIIENLISEPTEPYRVERLSSFITSLKISEGIVKYLEDKSDDDLRTKTGTEIKYYLNIFIEDYGDIPISSINIE